MEQKKEEEEKEEQRRDPLCLFMLDIFDEKFCPANGISLVDGDLWRGICG